MWCPVFAQLLHTSSAHNRFDNKITIKLLESGVLNEPGGSGTTADRPHSTNLALVIDDGAHVHLCPSILYDCISVCTYLCQHQYILHVMFLYGFDLRHCI